VSIAQSAASHHRLMADNSKKQATRVAVAAWVLVATGLLAHLVRRPAEPAPGAPAATSPSSTCHPA
jgi:hypothetical protein